MPTRTSAEVEQRVLAAQAKELLNSVQPRDVVGKTRMRVAAELVADLARIYERKKAANKELKALIAATGTGLMDLRGAGPQGAARLLVEVDDITRFLNVEAMRYQNDDCPIR